MTNVGGSRRAQDALDALAATTMITEADLDRAGIPHWRERLADAADLDEREQGVRRGRHYDLCWRLLRDELGKAALPVEPAPDVAVRPSFPDRQDPDSEEPF